MERGVTLGRSDRHRNTLWRMGRSGAHNRRLFCRRGETQKLSRPGSRSHNVHFPLPRMRSHLHRRSVVVPFVLSLVIPAAAAFAQPAAPTEPPPPSSAGDSAKAAADAAAAASADLVKRLDPTDFRTRIESRLETQATQDQGERHLIVPRLDYAVSKTFAIRIETPLHQYAPGPAGGATVTGFGDLSVRGAWRVYRAPGLAVVTGVEGWFDTATEAAIGLGKHIVAPFFFMAFDAPSINSTIFPGLQHYESFAGQDARAHVSFTQARLFVLTRWPNRFYTGIENQFTVDHRRNGRAAFTIEAEVGRFIDKHWAAWVRPGVALLGDELPYIYNWNMEVGLRYVFD